MCYTFKISNKCFLNSFIKKINTVFIKAFIIKRGDWRKGMGRKQSPKLEKNLIRSISTFKIPHPHSHGPSLSFTRQILLIVPFVLSNVRR